MIRWSFIFALCFGMAHAEMSYVHSDHLGSTSVATNEGGNVQQVAIYSPYGEILTPHLSSSPQRGEERGEGATPHLYTGQEFDAEDGLHYYGARYYDPMLSRFLSVDPVFDGFTSYGYVGNNPILWVDPTGETAKDAGDFLYWSFISFGRTMTWQSVPRDLSLNTASLQGYSYGTTAATLLGMIMNYTGTGGTAAALATGGGVVVTPATLTLAAYGTTVVINGARTLSELGLSLSEDTASSSGSGGGEDVGDEDSSQIPLETVPNNLRDANGVVRVPTTGGDPEYAFHERSSGDGASHRDVARQAFGRPTRGASYYGLSGKSGKVTYLGRSSVGEGPSLEEAKRIVADMQRQGWINEQFLEVMTEDRTGYNLGPQWPTPMRSASGNWMMTVGDFLKLGE
ncbi:MAG: RHS repeat-associated core domain-containing protein [Deltaproteobacteria bacterium]|nr:RHS repeat-associated core domain-containing protein [Deltaproteobacteria bacterium]